MKLYELIDALSANGYLNAIVVDNKKFEYCADCEKGAIYGHWNCKTREDEFVRTWEEYIEDHPSDKPFVTDCEVVSIYPEEHRYIRASVLDGKDKIFHAEEIKYQQELVEDDRLEITVYSVGGAWYGYKAYYRGKTWESDLQENQMTLEDIETEINDNLYDDFGIDTTDNEIKLN